jgi:hypothetical protein
VWQSAAESDRVRHATSARRLSGLYATSLGHYSERSGACRAPSRQRQRWTPVIRQAYMQNSVCRPRHTSSPATLGVQPRRTISAREPAPCSAYAYLWPAGSGLTDACTPSTATPASGADVPKVFRPSDNCVIGSDIIHYRYIQSSVNVEITVASNPSASLAPASALPLRIHADRVDRRCNWGDR